ncbi:MAG: class I SAM-dependent methyltransferase [Candidatus Bathyarchaeota archaeon]|nr:class I SAM-dependent methyltransferase [Candidatus Bathyarchaeota archaeon]MDH5687284.1 class I SAM-dependent methyltransferase [Candidatus Bathyarchaeota archaeon]
MRSSSVEVKRKNILHHDAEADFFEIAHPEGSSVYERSKVLENIQYILRRSGASDLCVDVGCGTGLNTRFELPLYRFVLAADISRRMLEVVKSRFGDFCGLHFVVCDAENLPLRGEIADMISVSSVLHHLPEPHWAIREMARALRLGGFLCVMREPNDVRFRRFFAFLDEVIVRRLVQLFKHLSFFEKPGPESGIAEGLDYPGVDVHYPSGFNVEEILGFLLLNHFEMVSAYSYHWIYPIAGTGPLSDVLSRANFIIEKIPLSGKLGRYVCIVARRLQ